MDSEETEACRHLQCCHLSWTLHGVALLQTQAGPTSPTVMFMYLCVLLRSGRLSRPVWNQYYFETAQSKATSSHGNKNVKCMLVTRWVIDFAKSHLLVTVLKRIDDDWGEDRDNNKIPSILLDTFNYQESLSFYLKISLSFYLPSLLEESWKKRKPSSSKTFKYWRQRTRKWQIVTIQSVSAYF